MFLSTKQLLAQPKAIEQYGKKAQNLVYLQELGVNVPKFVVLPSGIIRDILGKSSDNWYKTGVLETEPELTDVQKKQILLELSEHFSANELVAVRSSAKLEDGDTASFAGMFRTNLEVALPDVPKSILACIKSSFSDSLLVYSRRNNIDPTENELSLIVQKMVTASVSGIVFTINSVGNYNDMHISAGLGSGEGIVSNKTDATSYFVNRQNKNIHIGDGTPDILTEAQVIALFDQCMVIEKRFKYPQDIEFSFDIEGKLHFLQSRNITNIDTKNLKILDNSNIVESYPGTTLPLSFDFARDGYQQVFTAAARLFGISETDIKSIEPELSQMITHLHSRVYYNLHHWYKLMQMVIADKNSLQAWETLIGIKSAPSRGIQFSPLKKIKATYRNLNLLVRYPKIVAGFYANFERDFSPLRAYTDQLYSTNPNGAEALETLQKASDKIFVNWAATLLNDFFTFKFYDYLRRFVASFGIAESDNIANDLLCGIPGVDSEKPILELLGMKKTVCKNDQLLAAFRTAKPDEIAQKIQQNNPELHQQIQTYIQKYGDRTLEELKLESPNFRLNPDGFYELLKTQLDNKNTPESFAETQQNIRENAEKLIAEKLKYSPIKRVLFRYILNKTKETVRNRENMRIRRAMAYGVAKEIFYYLGTHLTKQGHIEIPTDIYYLGMKEIKMEFYQNKYTENKPIEPNYINLIKQRIEKDRQTTLPDRIIFEDSPPKFGKTQQIINLDKDVFQGTGISKGKVSAQVSVLHEPAFSADIDGKILVTRMTDPAWVFLMSRAAGIITEKGSPLSHTAIVGRELGIPVIIGLQNATALLQTDDQISMDGHAGIVQRTKL